MLFTQTGFLAALPYVVKAFVGPAGGILVDWLIKNKMSVRNTRRCVFTFGKTKFLSQLPAPDTPFSLLLAV